MVVISDQGDIKRDGEEWSNCAYSLKWSQQDCWYITTYS